MEKEIVSQAQEAKRASYRINPRRNMPRHILINLTRIKCKERILKAAREKQNIIYKGNPIYLTAELSAETLQAKREWQNIFKVLKGKNLQPRLFYPTREKSKAFRQMKVKRIQYQQTSFTHNVKWTYIVRKYRRKKNLQNQTPNN